MIFPSSSHNIETTSDVIKKTKFAMVMLHTTAPRSSFLCVDVLHTDIVVMYNKIDSEAVRLVVPIPVTKMQPNIHQLEVFPVDKYGSTRSITEREAARTITALNMIALTTYLF
jgi:hypothetical protein